VGPQGLQGSQGERGEIGERGQPGEKGLAGVAGQDGRDGIDVTDAVVNREGRLILTYSDGRTKDVGIVVGRDIDDAAVMRRIEDQVKSWLEQQPKPKDGINGKDGLGFEESEIVLDPVEGWLFRLKSGDRMVQHRLPLPFDAGTYQAGKRYPQGAMVNAKGLWIAVSDTRDKPGESKAWRLIVRNGRDGRDRIVPPEDAD
jgi:hypothetical protein